jgi:hypothetical protein
VNETEEETRAAEDREATMQVTEDDDGLRAGVGDH